MRSFFGSLRGRAAQAQRSASPFIKMRRLLKVGLGLVVGTICGGVVGAAMLAVPTYFEDGCSLLGCAKD